MTGLIIPVGGAAIVLGVLGWALMIPASRSGKASLEIRAATEAIVAVSEAVELQPEWRDGIVSVERNVGG